MNKTKYVTFSFMMDYTFNNIQECSVDVYYQPDPNVYEQKHNSKISEAVVVPPKFCIGRSKPFNKEYFGCYKLKE